MNDSKSVVVLHSGGLDSTTCLLLAKSEGFRPISLGVSYGQRSVEMHFAASQCARFGIERHIIDVRWEKPARAVPMNRSVDEIRSGVSTAFLPGRNLLFLSLANAHASGVKAQEVWTGLNSVDFSGYPDCTPEFLAAFLQITSVANPNGPTTVAPLMTMSKPEIARMAQSLGLGPDDTWSCYRPSIEHGGIKPCGQCDACKLHAFAWQSV